MICRNRIGLFGLSGLFRLCIGVIAFIVGTGSARAADLMEVLPVTDTILLLHYREGHNEYNGVRPDGTYAPQADNTVHYSPLDIAAATDASRYRISSADDAAYTRPIAPARIGY